MAKATADKDVAEKVEEKSAKITVLKNFRDVNNFEKEYKEGDTVEGFASERIENLKKAGLVK